MVVLVRGYLVLGWLDLVFVAGGSGYGLWLFCCGGFLADSVL